MVDVMPSESGRSVPDAPPPGPGAFARLLLGAFARLLGTLVILIAGLMIGLIAYASQFICDWSTGWFEGECRYRGIGRTIGYLITVTIVGAAGVSLIARIGSWRVKWWQSASVGAIAGLLLALALLLQHRPWLSGENGSANTDPVPLAEVDHSRCIDVPEGLQRTIESSFRVSSIDQVDQHFVRLDRLEALDWVAVPLTDGGGYVVAAEIEVDHSWTSTWGGGWMPLNRSITGVALYYWYGAIDGSSGMAWRAGDEAHIYKAQFSDLPDIRFNEGWESEGDQDARASAIACLGYPLLSWPSWSEVSNEPTAAASTTTTTQAETTVAQAPAPSYDEEEWPGLAALVLASNGLGVVDFGERAEEALALLEEVIGVPVGDQLWAEAEWVSFYGWDDLGLSVGFNTPGWTGYDESRFVGWHYRPEGVSRLVTAEGIGVGSSVAELRAAYGDQLALPDQEGECVPWVFRVAPLDSEDDPILGNLDGPPTDSATVLSLWGGMHTGC